MLERYETHERKTLMWGYMNEYGNPDNCAVIDYYGMRIVTDLTREQAMEIVRVHNQDVSDAWANEPLKKPEGVR